MIEFPIQVESTSFDPIVRIDIGYSDRSAVACLKNVELAASVRLEGEDNFWFVRDCKSLAIELIRESLCGRDERTVIVDGERHTLWNK